MTIKGITLGTVTLQNQNKEVVGSFVHIDGVEYYKISNYDYMDPFFISVVSDSDHWLYISTTGGLSAGRKNPENSLFPYYTDDKITDSGDLTGSKTILLVTKSDTVFLWEPFSERYKGIYNIERNIYKSAVGNQLIFEEINHDLGATFSYSWNTSQKYGFVKKSKLRNINDNKIEVLMVDGLQNLLPYGIDQRMQNEYSTLLDAYKKNELLEDSGLGLFLLSAIPIDKAEPSESLKAATVWSYGIETNTHLLSSVQLDRFRKGLPLTLETDIRARRGAYFIESNLILNPKETQHWYFVAETNQSPSKVIELSEWIKQDSHIEAAIEEDIASGTKRLVHIVASADGLQKSKDKMLDTRHFANVMFNVMRGGIFNENYEVHKKDFVSFIKIFNTQIFSTYNHLFQCLPDSISYSKLQSAIEETQNPQLKRLCLEYLPLTFSRRHGDPSRPWNQFSIELVEENAEKKLYYAGNWRDIFQNWEALGLSYPNFLEGIISKFVNASTADGYNPYRITRNGIDWEVIEKDDPWSYIGYWGDHQIIYLLKLLELSKAHYPAALEQMLTQRNFAYANVPYRIKSYQNLLKNPKDTVDFDHELERMIEERISAIGADGKLLWDSNNEVYLVNLAEKILVTLLAKLSNFIPEGGIWLNTQRPEWNDANNALVGNGVSMVTLYYIRRYITFCQRLFSESSFSEFPVSSEVHELFSSLAGIFEEHKSVLNGSISDTLRKRIVDQLGKAGEAYRSKVYKGFSEEREVVSVDRIHRFFITSLSFIDHSIEVNQRPNKLYHSYNLLSIKGDEEIAIRNLYAMLEGQVAVLSSGKLTPQEVAEVLDALRNSVLYRENQHSYILYPDRKLPRFERKNIIPKEAIEKSVLLTQMIGKNDQRIVEKDVLGQFHFNGSFTNMKDVKAVLDSIEGREYGSITRDESESILSIFETVFDHQSFTGRSGTFFGYEGLGSIYWHMVSKLILAVEENCWEAIDKGADQAIIDKLIHHYYDMREGLGTHKDPKTYGAFPSDPYSHTPGHAGAKQPGMTGQVKEDILSRFSELGVFVDSGTIKFRTGILKTSEFLSNEEYFEYVDVNGTEKKLMVTKGSLAFTYCQVPFIYQLGNTNSITIYFTDGSTIGSQELTINLEVSSEIMNRTGDVDRVVVTFQKG